MQIYLRRLGALLAMASIAVAACGSSTSSAAPSQPASGAASGGTAGRCTRGDGQLNGAGSTFIFPLLSKMGEDYNNACGVKLNYQSIGSGGGVKQFTENTVDFGASDAFLSDAEIQTASEIGRASCRERV